MGFKPSRRRITGQLKLPTQGSSGGILLGGDVHLYRTSANILKLDDSLWLNTTSKLYFYDNAIYISAKNDGHLDLDADVSIDLNTPIVEISGANKLRFGGDAGFYRGGAGRIDLDASFLFLSTTKYIRFRDSAIYISSKDDGHLDLDANASIDLNSPIVTVEQGIEHAGDIDTYIEFLTNQIKLRAGNVKQIDINATGVGFCNTAPQAQQAHIVDPTDLAECITVLATLLADLEGYGLLASV